MSRKKKGPKKGREKGPENGQKRHEDDPKHQKKDAMTIGLTERQRKSE
jgi:hypothetical protein